jgi:hypothetical protein
MKTAYALLLAIIAALSCARAQAVPYPNEDQLRAGIAAAALVLKAEGLEVKVLDAQKEGLTRPLLASGLRLADSVCLVFFNTRPEDGLNQFFDSISEQDLPVWLSAMAVHELTHCIEQREAYIRNRFDKVLPPGFPRDNVTVQGYLSVVKSGAVEGWGEVLADIASVLYLKQAVPGQWLRFTRRLAAMRHGLAWKWPAHDTSAWLYRIMDANDGVAANESLFDTAFELRRKYRPDAGISAVSSDIPR